MSETCAYCDAPFAPEPGRRHSRDHIVPKIMRLNLGQKNLADACGECNQIKGSMTPDAMDALAVDVDAVAARLRLIASKVRGLMAERGLSARHALALSKGSEG